MHAAHSGSYMTCNEHKKVKNGLHEEILGQFKYLDVTVLLERMDKPSGELLSRDRFHILHRPERFCEGVSPGHAVRIIGLCVITCRNLRLPVGAWSRNLHNN